MDESVVGREALIGFTEEMKNYFITEELVRNIVYRTRQGAKVLKRNEQYDINDIVYSESLPVYYKLVCIQSGTTGDNEPDLT